MLNLQLLYPYYTRIPFIIEMPSNCFKDSSISSMPFSSRYHRLKELAFHGGTFPRQRRSGDGRDIRKALGLDSVVPPQY